MKKQLLLLLVLAISIGAWADTATLTFDSACAGSGTDDKGNTWTVTSDAAESNYDGTKGIHYGTSKAAVSYLKLATSSISGTITKIVVYASGASGTSATISAAVNGEAFGGAAQSLTSTNTSYTFNGSASGNIEITLSQTSTTKALYVKQVEVTYSAVLKPQHTASFSVNGTIDNGDDCVVREDEAITFPSDPADIYGKKFVGWTKTADYSNATVAPSDLCKAANMGTADVTYYAVFAHSEGSLQWRKVNASAISTEGEGVYAIITTDGHAFNGTISSGHGQVTSLAFAFNSEGIATSAPAGTCEITLTGVTGGYTMYNSSNGYLYATANSSGKLAWHNTESSYWLYKSNNWTYNTNTAYLRSYNNTSIRTYGANNGDVLVFAKKENIQTYSNYCTTVSPNTFNLTIGSSNWASMYLDFAAKVPAGATAYYASSVAKDIITLTSIDAGEVIPANTGVLVNGTSCTFTESNATPATVSNNLFEGVTEETTCEANANWVLNTAETVNLGSPVLSLYTGTTLGANKAYIPASAVPSGAKTLQLVFGESTGIQSVQQNAQNGVAYNLAGQRVAANAKGIVIINGKKYLNK